MTSTFQKTIAEFDTITIFRHEHPDMDALGSQFGLRQWLLENYPNKEIYVCGESTLEFSMDKVDDKTIRKSLAIVLDTANKSRVDDCRFELAQKTMMIDHHPVVEQYCDINYINVNAAATCEALTDLFYDSHSTLVSKKTAEYLYKGLLTDTLCFKTNNTTSNTLYAASRLAKCEIDISTINRELFDIDYETYRFITLLRTKIQIKGKLAYIILHQEDVEPYNLTLNKAREFVSELGGVKEFQIWCIFTEDYRINDDVIYNGSLRSKIVTINEIASKFNGGGHKNACGVKKLTTSQIKELLDDLLSLIN